jgi:hypothetical protein
MQVNSWRKVKMARYFTLCAVLRILYGKYHLNSDIHEYSYSSLV